MRDSVLVIPNLSKFEIMPQDTHAKKSLKIICNIVFLFSTCSQKKKKKKGKKDRFGAAVGIGFLLA